MRILHAIRSRAELSDYLRSADRTYLLLYRKGSEASDCAYANIRAAAERTDEITLLCADVNTVRDIHEAYGVTSVPSLLEFEQGALKNVTKGCSGNAYYRDLFGGSGTPVPPQTGQEKPKKRVTVYSTPSCPWCTTLKNYLKERGIPYTDVDVSRDMRAAEDLVRRSGQRGVPQTDINGQIVVGFDKARLNHLLEING